MSQQRRREENGPFTAKWGVHIADYNYTQVPNLLIRNLSKLNLSTVEESVILIIISYAPNYFIATSQFSERLGISKSTVKNTYRSLERKGYIARIAHTGSANTFSHDGLKRALQLIAIQSYPVQISDTLDVSASDRTHRVEQNNYTPRAANEHPPGQPDNTNKELKKGKNKKTGFDKWKEEREYRSI